MKRLGAVLAAVIVAGVGLLLLLLLALAIRTVLGAF